MTALALLFLCFLDPAIPGDLNHAEGDVVRLSETIETRNGQAEILLTPGVFLRLAKNSTLALTPTPHLIKGRALIEAAFVSKPVSIGGAVTAVSAGLYLFDAGRNSISVYQGKARVGKVLVKAGRELDLATFTESTFNRKATDDLYRWSKLRSSTLAVATRDAAHSIIYGHQPWTGAGWYPNQARQEYVFLPSDGELRSPFGFWYQSPWVEYAPLRPMFSC